jgi:hypothetical protein
MQLSRRGFIGALTGAVASGPKAVAKAVAPAGIGQTLIHNISIGEQRYDGCVPSEDKNWAKRKLANWLLPDFHDKEYREFSVYELHPDLYALRSMSLSAKMRIQKRRSFEIYKKKDMHFLQKCISGDFR